VVIERTHPKGVKSKMRECKLGNVVNWRGVLKKKKDVTQGLDVLLT